MSSHLLTEEILGKRVHYVRITKDNTAERGFGIVRSIALDAEDRKIVIIKTEDGVYNIDRVAIDASPVDQDAYIAGVKSIRARAEEANAQLRAITEKANEDIRIKQDDVAGVPVISESLEVEEIKETTAA